MYLIELVQRQSMTWSYLVPRGGLLTQKALTGKPYTSLYTKLSKVSLKLHL